MIRSVGKMMVVMMMQKWVTMRSIQSSGLMMESEIKPLYYLTLDFYKCQVLVLPIVVMMILYNQR